MTVDPPASQRGVARALKDASLAGLIAFGLFLPLIGFLTVQNMRNELELETRWRLLAIFVAIVVVARLAFSVLSRPKVWTFLVEFLRSPLPLLVGILVSSAVAAAAWALTGPVSSLLAAIAPQGGIGEQVWLGLVATLAFTIYGLIAVGLLVNVVCTIALVAALVRRAYWGLIEHGIATKPQVDGTLRAAALGFLLAYPAISIALVGWQGSIKWIDNFGIQILIYVMLGWGLNIVVGLAGLLDLGYVAFYAVGAYSYALLAKEFGLSFWLLLPLAGILSAFWGILLGFPVLRLRGDYLAIVTLAFGEIIRLVLINWVAFTNGYAGVSGIPRPTFFGIPFNANDDGFAAIFGLEFTPMYRTIFLYYVIVALALLTAFVTARLRRLPVGRAWEALREDEIACRSLGINTTNTKLTAFSMGAMFGGFAGAFFAARQGFISPESFTFMESAIILAIVVLGGMGSMVGVAVAAIAMIGGTEIMRDLDFLKAVFGNDFDPTQYRMLLFGFAMVLIMIWKPRGLISTREPSAFLKERKAISSALVKEGHG